jgi:hypothetical protein
MSSIYINWHLGLGDAIICAPIAVKYSQQYEKVYVPAYDRNVVSVKSFFVNHQNIEVIPQYLKVKAQVLNLGFNNEGFPRLPHESFDQWFYRQAGMEIEDKERFNPFPEAAKGINTKTNIPENISDLVFVHDDITRGFVIDKNLLPEGNKYSPFPNYDRSVLSFHKDILKAKEIHCIDSSFLHLCDALPTTGKLYWHRYARNFVHVLHEVKLTKQWEIIN